MGHLRRISSRQKTPEASIDDLYQMGRLGRKDPPGLLAFDGCCLSLGLGKGYLGVQSHAYGRSGLFCLLPHVLEAKRKGCAFTGLEQPRYSDPSSDRGGLGSQAMGWELGRVSSHWQPCCQCPAKSHKACSYEELPAEI